MPRSKESASQKKKKVLTLCLLCRDGEILLGMKKRGFGVGRWNGFGGKQNEGETIEQAAKREVREEVGIEAESLERRGIIEFSFRDDPKVLEVHIFKVVSHSGSPKESEEMLPRWFKHAEIPYDQMWSGDICWSPLFLAGKRFKGRFYFDRPSDAEYASVILRKNLSEVNAI